MGARVTRFGTEYIDGQAVSVAYGEAVLITDRVRDRLARDWSEAYGEESLVGPDRRTEREQVEAQMRKVATLTRHALRQKNAETSPPTR